jgi:hypothetical protein
MTLPALSKGIALDCLPRELAVPVLRRVGRGSGGCARSYIGLAPNGTVLEAAPGPFQSDNLGRYDGRPS